MNPRKKMMWQEKVIHLSKTCPGMPPDPVMVELLIDLIVANERKLSDHSVAMLAGLAAAHWQRYAQTLPRPTHVTHEGEAVYTEADVAKALNLPIEKVRSMADDLRTQHGDASGICLTTADKLNPIH